MDTLRVRFDAQEQQFYHPCSIEHAWSDVALFFQSAGSVLL